MKAAGAPFGGKPAYSIVASLEVDTADQSRAAAAAASGAVFGDVPNFNNRSPVVMIGELMGAAP